MTEREETRMSKSGADTGGRFRLSQQVHVEYADGTQLVGPVNESLPSAEALRVSAGDIIDIACKIFPKLCGGGGGGGGGGGTGCYKVILPDGTTIEICPGKKAIA